jgi:hypothetical protein
MHRMDQTVNMWWLLTSKYLQYIFSQLQLGFHYTVKNFIITAHILAYTQKCVKSQMC